MTATLTMRECFLADILANPEDDAPRMAYADWLMENDDPYGEFIAVQLRLAEIESEVQSDEDCGQAECLACVERRRLKNRERELLQKTIPGQWSGFPRELCDRSASDLLTLWTFRRGFVHAVTLSAEDWLKHADALLAVQPVREVTLTTRPLVFAAVQERRSGRRPDPENRAGYLWETAVVRWGHRLALLREECHISDSEMKSERDAIAYLRGRRGFLQQDMQAHIDSLSFLSGEGGWWPSITFHLPEPA